MNKSELSKYHLTGIQSQFTLLDPTGKGITKEDCAFLFRALGQAPAERNLNEWLSKCFKSSDSRMKFEEFVEFYKKHASPLPTAEELIKVVRSFDIQIDGAMPAELLGRILGMGETPLNSTEISTILKHFGETCNFEPTGDIDYTLMIFE